MLFFIFIMGIIPCVMVSLKFLRCRDISCIDLFVLGNTLFFLLVPYKAYYIDRIAGFNLENKTTTLMYILCLLWLLPVSQLFIPRKKTIMVTSFIKHWLKNIHIPYYIVYLCLLAGSMILYYVTDFSQLSEEEFETNNMLFFGSDMPLPLRILWLFALESRPILFLLSLQLLRTKWNRYRLYFIYVTLFVTFMSFALGPKTYTVQFVAFIFIAYYSLYMKQLTTRKVIRYTALGCLFLIVYFPVSQGLRLVKQTSFRSGQKIDFVTAVENFINMPSEQASILQDDTNRYIKGRSLNVFECLDWTVERSFQGNGELTQQIVISLIPVPAKALGNNGNILGDVYLSKGADIGESIFAWFNADFRGWGIIFTCIFFYILIYSSYYYFRFLSRLLKNKYLMGFFVFFCVKYGFTVECNPSNFFHQFYVNLLLASVMLWLMVKLTNKIFHKEAIYILK